MRTTTGRATAPDTESLSNHPADPLPKPALFQSFWSAGFESATHINLSDQRLDMIAVTQHDQRVDEDYALLVELGIRTARDGVRWHLIDQGGRYDFSSLEPMALAARRHGIQVLWNLCHYGWPDDVDLFSPEFVRRFARYAGAVARFLRGLNDAVPFYTPINEISFLSWAAGDVGYIYPRAHGRGGEVKRQLVRAALAGMDAIWAVDPRARMAHVEPITHVVAPRERPFLGWAARREEELQYQSWDMISGRAAPELGGARRYLDILGANFYHDNQWEQPVPGRRNLRWDASPRDPRWRPLSRMLARVYQRYKRPLFIAETSHTGDDRPRWLHEVADEVGLARGRGVPVEGICLYPILDRPGWDNLDEWHTSGLFELERDAQGNLRRVLNESYAAELRRAQTRLAELGCGV